MTKVNNSETGINYLNTFIFFIGFTLVVCLIHVLMMALAGWRTRIGLARQKRVGNHENPPMTEVV
jgi:hypothetical protein